MSGGSRGLVIEGELTIHCAADRRGALFGMIEAGAHLELDLSGVTELDTAGLQVLLLARREVTQLGGRLTVTATSQVVRDVLAIVQIDPTDLSSLAGRSDPSHRLDRFDRVEAAL